MNVLNSILYTFSTIAQAIAGAIGLLGAFVLFRLQSLTTQIESLAEKLTSPLVMWADSMGAAVGTGEAIRQLLLEGKYQELLSHPGWKALPHNYYQAKLEREKLPALLATKRAVVRGFKVSLWLTVLLIVTSGIVLAAAQPIAERPCLSVWILAGGVVGLGGCLASYVWLMTRALR